MRNVIILGSARSGTSLTAGVLSQVGYFMGDNLYPPDIANPKGFFENLEINGINEELLAQVLPDRPPGILGSLFFRKRTVFWQRNYAKVPPGTLFSSSPELIERIKTLTKHEPFCFKDPRFCYTLPVWRPFLKNTVFICVFRHPAETAVSLVKQSQRNSQERGIKLNFKLEDALEVWTLMYRHILEVHYPQGGEWFFIHYNLFLDGSIFDALENILETKVDRNFVDPKLRRSSSDGVIVSPQILSIYHRLSKLSG